EEVAPFRHKHAWQQAKPILEALTEWCAERNCGPVEPDLPAGIQDRAADCWEPLLVVADEAGAHLPQRGKASAPHLYQSPKAAAVYLNNSTKDESLSPGVELLAHIKDAFGNDNADKLTTPMLLERLMCRDESPWRDIRGKPLDDRGLGKRLKPYGIKSRQVRV